MLKATNIKHTSVYIMQSLISTCKTAASQRKCSPSDTTKLRTSRIQAAETSGWTSVVVHIRCTWW